MKKPSRLTSILPSVLGFIVVFLFSLSTQAAEKALPNAGALTSKTNVPAPRAGTSASIKIRGQVIFPEGYPAGDVVVLYLSRGDASTTQKDAPKTWTIDQKNYQFSPALTVAKPQDTLRFKNSDPDLHTAVSHSGPLKGQTITTLKGQSHSVTLKESGYSEILCGIHAQMRADLLVIPTRNFIISRPDGSFEGTFNEASFPLEIQIWHPILVSSPLVLSEAPKNGAPLKITLTPQN